MKASRSISVVSCHAEGEVGDIITGGVLDVPAPTMKEKFLHWRTHGESLRQLILNEPRGRAEMSAVLLLPPCDPRADAGFVVMASGDYSPMSGSNCMCATTVLLETGMLEMKEPVTEVVFDTAAGLVTARARCEGGVCQAVSIDTVPAFVFGVDLPIDLPGVGEVSVDIAFGGRWFAFVDASSVGLGISSDKADQLREMGKRIKHAVLAKYSPVHPQSPEFSGIDNVGITEPLRHIDGELSAKQAMIIKPGRLDRSPCGNGSTARMAVFQAKGVLEPGHTVRFQSMIGTEFKGHIRGVTRVGGLEAILPTIEGRAWITAHKQVVLDPSDPFPAGYRSLL